MQSVNVSIRIYPTKIVGSDFHFSSCQCVLMLFKLIFSKDIGSYSSISRY